MDKWGLLFSLTILQIVLNVHGVHYLKFRQEPSQDHSCIVLEDSQIENYRGFSEDDENALDISMKPAESVPADLKTSDEAEETKIIEIFARSESVAKTHLNKLCKSKEYVQELDLLKSKAPEIVKIIDGGDQKNRIDVVFMGDGYQESERQEFFGDIARLTRDMFEGPTFRSYLPLFNIWAIFEPSVDSGIGYNGPRNTAFGLYRQHGQLRGIFPGNPSHARSVCRLVGANGCEYPSLIGNDDFYGGLGGEFVISTRSSRTGTVVLRHEMGHNFASVGEEYDNGQIYAGVNAAYSLYTLGWGKWLSGPRREERAIYRLLEYPWADLSQGPQRFTFKSDGTYSRWHMSVTVSAAGEEDCLEFMMDDKVLPWKSKGYDDREFYDWFGDQGFTPGQHTFSVRSKSPSKHPEIPRMICSIELHEFGSEEEFHFSNDYVSAYPTWDYRKRKSYRPTHAGCIMRNMSQPTFCPVCKEGMWYQFLRRVSLIDSLNVSKEAREDGTKEVSLETLKLAQFRAPGNLVEGETLSVTWSRLGVERTELRNKYKVRVNPGTWTVTVKLSTPEVRSDPYGLLRETKFFIV